MDTRWHFGGPYGYEFDVQIIPPVGSGLSSRLESQAAVFLGQLESYRRASNLQSLTWYSQDSAGNFYEYGVIMGRPYAVIRVNKAVLSEEYPSSVYTPAIVWMFQPDSGVYDATLYTLHTIPGARTLRRIPESGAHGLKVAKENGTAIQQALGISPRLTPSVTSEASSDFLRGWAAMSHIADLKTFDKSLNDPYLCYTDGGLYVGGVLVTTEVPFAAMLYGTRLIIAVRSSGAIVIKVGTVRFNGATTFETVSTTGLPTGLLKAVGAFKPTRNIDGSYTLEWCATSSSANYYGAVLISKPVATWVGSATTTTVAAPGTYTDSFVYAGAEPGSVAKITVTQTVDVTDHQTVSYPPDPGVMFDIWSGEVVTEYRIQYPEFIHARLSRDVPERVIRVGVDYDKEGNLYELFTTVVHNEVLLQSPAVDFVAGTVTSTVTTTMGASGPVGFSTRTVEINPVYEITGPEEQWIVHSKYEVKKNGVVTHTENAGSKIIKTGPLRWETKSYGLDHTGKLSEILAFFKSEQGSLSSWGHNFGTFHYFDPPVWLFSSSNDVNAIRDYEYEGVPHHQVMKWQRLQVGSLSPGTQSRPEPVDGLVKGTDQVSLYSGAAAPASLTEAYVDVAPYNVEFADEYTEGTQYWAVTGDPGYAVYNTVDPNDIPQGSGEYTYNLEWVSGSSWVNAYNTINLNPFFYELLGGISVTNYQAGRTVPLLETSGRNDVISRRVGNNVVGWVSVVPQFSSSVWEVKHVDGTTVTDFTNTIKATTDIATPMEWQLYPWKVL